MTDDLTPIIIGVGQVTDRPTDPTPHARTVVSRLQLPVVVQTAALAIPGPLMR